MATFNTPGVYIEEIPVFPASIAGVDTSIPAFIGYVEKAENNGIGIPFFTPTRITSLLEYQTIFGGAEGQNFVITIDDDTTVSPTQRNISLVKSPESKFKLYYNLQMYFSNGGGPCYIVPTGLYTDAPLAVSKDDMLDGLSAIAKVDEPTLLLFPDAISLTTPAHRSEVYDAALAQCEKLKDRFTIMDVLHFGVNSVSADAAAFRNAGIGPDNLKYGASYYPFLNSTLGFGLNQDLLHINFQNVNGSAFDDSGVTITFLNDVELALAKAKEGLNNAKIQIVTFDTSAVLGFLGSIQTLVGNVLTSIQAATLPSPFNTPVAKVTAVSDANDYVSNGLPPGDFFTANDTYGNGAPPSQADADFMIATYNQLISDLVAIRQTAYQSLADPTLSGYAVGSLANLQNTNPALYNSIIVQLNDYTVQINPSGAMAGIYTRVDAERGVWKAPANVGVRAITGPSINVTAAEQGGLNVDPTSGKSINVIRSFTGRGTLVWGARTLAGNDNEWRYINVRRLFNYMEESIQEATAFVVFEPNDANTWQKVKGMIEAFLSGLWRDGALAGATTKEAYFVRVGLGTTMSAQDILEGRMIVEIGVAAVRPAEFIILRFEHKLQES